MSFECRLKIKIHWTLIGNSRSSCTGHRQLLPAQIAGKECLYSKAIDGFCRRLYLLAGLDAGKFGLWIWISSMFYLWDWWLHLPRWILDSLWQYPDRYSSYRIAGRSFKAPLSSIFNAFLKNVSGHIAILYILQTLYLIELHLWKMRFESWSSGVWISDIMAEDPITKCDLSIIVSIKSKIASLPKIHLVLIAQLPLVSR